MKLYHIENYGAKTHGISKNASIEDIESLMQELDWQGFHQVVLEKNNGDWLEVGGSLNPEDGLSVMFEENGKQLVIKTPPQTVVEMMDFLTMYLSGSQDWKNKAVWL